jgi:hypothetical protein
MQIKLRMNAFERMLNSNPDEHLWGSQLTLGFESTIKINRILVTNAWESPIFY